MIFESDLIETVDKLPKKLDPEGRKATLQEEVELSKATDDAKIIKLYHFSLITR